MDKNRRETQLDIVSICMILSEVIKALPKSSNSYIFESKLMVLKEIENRNRQDG